MRPCHSKRSENSCAFDQFYESPAYAVDVAGSLTSSWFDLPPGSATIQVVASLLDHLQPLPEHRHHRLIEATEKLVEDGAWEREAAERLYEAVL